MKFFPTRMMLAFALLGASLRAAEVEEPAALVESKPVVVNGLEFVAVVQEVWPRWAENVVVQWRVKNVSQAEILLAEPFSHALAAYDLQGHEVTNSEGSRLNLGRPLLLRPGTTMTFAVACGCPQARIVNQAMTFYGGGQGVTVHAPTDFHLTFKVRAPRPHPASAQPDPRRWHGNAETSSVAIHIQGPKS